MRVTVEYVLSGTVRTYSDLTQREVNVLISHISSLQDSMGEVGVKIAVK